MKEYKVTLANHTPQVVSVMADEVSFDAHWVVFRQRDEPEPEPPLHCEECGHPTGVKRARIVRPSMVVGLYPANQVRRVSAT